MPRPTLKLLPALLALLVSPAVACIWDSDTLLDERRGLPGVGEILAGKWERHSPFFYEQRLQVMTARLAKDPHDLPAWDDFAVALEKLGRAPEAIDAMVRKDKLAPGQYTTEANLGTFYLHTGDLENGMAHIRKALAINPDAHFGREKYQLMAAEYLLEARRDPAVYDRGSFIVPELLGPQRVAEFGPDLYPRFIATMRSGLPRLTEAERAATAKPLEGIVGMIRFGTGTSPHLFHALGDLLAYRGDRHLASRAYRRALQYNHPRPELLKEAIESVEAAVEDRKELSDTLIATEQSAAEAWVKAYQQFEDDLLRAGREPATEADYAPFYAKFGTARPTVSSRDATANFLRKLLRVESVPAELCALVLLVGAIQLARMAARRRNRHASRAAAPA